MLPLNQVLGNKYQSKLLEVIDARYNIQLHQFSTLVFLFYFSNNHGTYRLNRESVSYRNSWAELAPVETKVAAWFLIRALGMMLTL